MPDVCCLCLQKHLITPTFTVLPQSPTHVRVVYRSVYCLDLQCRGANLISVRDGAYSMFESNKAVEGLNPIPNLQVTDRYSYLVDHVCNQCSVSTPLHLTCFS
jgi:hypothetical protein